MTPSSKDEGGFFPRATSSHYPQQHASGALVAIASVQQPRVHITQSWSCASGCGHAAEFFLTIPPSLNFHNPWSHLLQIGFLGKQELRQSKGLKFLCKMPPVKSTREKQGWAQRAIAMPPASPGALEQVFSIKGVIAWAESPRALPHPWLGVPHWSTTPVPEKCSAVHARCSWEDRGSWRGI